MPEKGGPVQSGADRCEVYRDACYSDITRVTCSDRNQFDFVSLAVLGAHQVTQVTHTATLACIQEIAIVHIDYFQGFLRRG